MRILGIIPELPLLRRELTELSSRRRTYVIRFGGAIIVLMAVMLYYDHHVALFETFGTDNPAQIPGAGVAVFRGVGGPIFKGIVPMLFVAVQLLMPALICGAITLEKERNTIGTLFVTRLSPMTIVLEKLGSRLVPMFTFLLLTFPVLAVLYSLGGVESTLLLGTLWLLLCECLLYASIGLLCSSWFATTVTAFIWSYVLTGLLAVFAGLAADGPRPGLPTPYYLWLATFQGFNNGYVNSSMQMQSSDSFLSTLGDLLFVGATTIPSLMVTAFCVLLARAFLVRRAFISSASVLLKVFKAIDVFFTKLNDRTTGGVVLMKDNNSMPLFDPVAWRERSKKSLGKARYLFRILVVTEGPTLYICLGSVTTSARTDFSGPRDLLLLVWAIAAMILAMKGSTLIASERVRETLEALLSTPLTSKEILTQKIDGMKRLMIVLAIPILSVHLTLLLLNVNFRTMVNSPQTAFIVVWYIVSCVLTTLLTMRILAWLAILLGLRSASQSRSATMAICLITAWVLLTSWTCRPGGIVFETLNMTSPAATRDISRRAIGYEEVLQEQRSRTIASAVCCLLRPDGGVQANEAVLIAIGTSRTSWRALYYAPSRSVASALTVSAVVFLWQLLLLILIRAVTLRLAPRLLGRHDQRSDYESFRPQLSPSIPVIGSEVIA